MFHGWQEWENGDDDFLRTGSRRVGVWRWVGRPIAEFFCGNFFMNSLTDELLGIKQPKFDVGDLVKTRAATDAWGMPWLGIITKVTLNKNRDGNKKNVYTVDWVAGGEADILWYDFYDEELDLIQPGANC